MIKAIPFNFPYDGNFVAANTALVVIDLQEDFLSTTGYFAKHGYDPTPLRAILPTVNRLIAAARAAGLKIIHTRQGYRADMADMTPYEKWRRKRAGIEGTEILLRSSPGFHIVAEIDVAAEDIIVDKTCNGAFTYTDFEHVLRAQGITHLLFSGCTTDVCVHTTLREACDRNFQCLTISDACASGDQRAHEAALHMVTVENGIFGALSDSAAVIEALQDLSGKAS
ncbi:nicotinamidase-related amidase [Aminobacter aminovorans]|jgi:nicotinamidase-related amidase|uniref:Peroxyureidoacrylate/ureidoacrylate amidohydrolase RutB n=1 Tax=Aminobacter aminovorans TaxID=83263 RepID=A0A380WHX2_AMIAI|nr:isochorismatase family cysteine hydrolase [Aminobacter aminovorans]TCS26603.1 nicotinamidase-related amidase [Aminobacter aminovorans]SUU88338.1 Peroxyureidoacrylate/ureidoacrylate amidohydrolase RutB [Aminobacter aminovorans]